MAKNLRDRGYGSSMDGYNAQQEKKRKEEEAKRLTLPKAGTASGRASSTYGPSAPSVNQQRHTRQKTTQQGTATVNKGSRVSGSSVGNMMPTTGAAAPVSTQRMGMGDQTKVSLYDFNRSPTLKNNYGTYDNYVAGQRVTGGGYTSPPAATDPNMILSQQKRQGALMGAMQYQSGVVERAYDKVLKAYGGEEAFNRQYDMVRRMESNLKYLEHQAKTGAISSDAYDAAYNRYTQEFTKAVQMYDAEGKNYAKKAEKAAATAEYAKASDAFERMKSDYYRFGAELGTQMMAEKQAYDEWRGKIRDEKDIQPEIDSLKNEREAVYEQLSGYEALQRQMTADLSSGSAQNQATAQMLEDSMNLSEEIKRLQAKYDDINEQLKLTEEELTYSRYFYWQSMADANVRGEVNRGTRAPKNSLIDKVIRGEATPDEQQQAIQNFNFSAPNAAMMTDAERKKYEQILSKHGSTVAMEYYNELEKTSLNTRRRMDEEKWIRDIMDKSPDAWAAMNILSVLTKPMQVFSHVGQTADMIFSGEMEKDASYNAFTYLNNAVRNKSTEDVQKTWGQWGAFGYQTGMSMLDFLYNTAITGGFGTAAGTAKTIAENMGLLLMGSEAAADATMQAKERGLSDNQAYWLGVISGAAEIATEKISLDTLLAKIPEGKGWKGYVQYLAKNVAAEASEEGASDMINLVADILITKDQSEWAQAVMGYERQGMSPEEAFRQALVDQAEQTGMSMLGGALSGGGMALGSMAINFAKNTRALTERGSVDRLIRQGMALGENSEAYKTAEALQAKLDTEGKIDLVTALRANRTISDATITDQKNVQEMIRAAKEYEGSEAAKQAEAIEKKTARGETVTAKEAMKLSDALAEELTVDPARLTGMLEQGKASAEDSEAYRRANALQKKIDAGKRLTVAEVNRAQEAIDGAVSDDMKSKSAEAIGRRLVTQDGQAALNEAISTVKEYGTAKMKEKAESLSMGQIDAQTAGEVFLESERIWNRAQERAANTRTLQPRNVTEGMSELERTAARIGVSEEETARVKAIADLLGADVRYYNQAAESYERAGTRYRRTENGRYDRSTGTIWLNAQSTNPVMTVLSHELTHSLEQTEKYGEFKNLVLELSGDLRKSIEQTYADRGLDAEGIDHEIVARYVEERLLTDEQAIRDAVNRSRSFGQWMKDQIDKILAKLGDTDAQERVTLQKARDLYAQALKEKAGAQRATEGKLTLPKAGVQESVTEQEDTDGRTLSKKQEEYFADSKARDSEGRLLTLYHGTRKGGFTEFRDWTYLTGDRQYAERYADKDTGETVYEVYANVKKPFDTRDPVTRRIFENEFYGKYSRTGLQESGLPDWTDGYDLAEFIEENDYDYDGILLDEGADPLDNGNVKERGISYVVRSSEQIKNVDNRNPTRDKDIRFSMSEEVERTDRLIAWHNMNEDALRSALELGGLAMPSWAIKTADRAHSSYGNISVIAPRNLVDPKRNRSSMIFGGDAWTPVFPDVNYKVTRESAEKLENEIKGLVGENVYRQIGGAALDADNISDQLRRSNGALPGHYRENLLLKYAYLKSLGRDVNLPTKEAELDRFYKFTNDEVRKFAGKLTNGLKTIERFRSMSIDELMQQEDLKQAIVETKEEYYREEMKDPALFEKMRKAGFFTKDISFSEIDAMLSAAQEYLMQGVEQTIDKREAQDLIDREINKKEFETWALKKLNETVERKGIRNNKELYTPSGNRRSFDALNYEYTLANIVRAMRQQPKQGRTEFLSGPGSVKGAALKSYNDVEQVRAARGRLVDTAEQGKEAYDAYDENLKDILSRMSRRGDLFDAANALIEVLQNAKTERGIYNYMQRELADWYNVTPEIANDIYNLIEQINELPMEYFEGKTYDAVGFDETAAVVVPDSMDADLKAQLEDAGANVVEYKAGDDADRLEKVNSVQDAAFSVTEEEDGPRGLTLPMAGPNPQNYTNASWERYDAARNAAQYMLDNASSDAERARGEEAMKAAEKLLQKKSAGRKQETELIGKPIEATKRLTNRLLDMFQVEQLDRAEIREYISQFAQDMANKGEVTDDALGQLWARLRYYARGTITPEGQEYFKAIRDKLKGSRIYVDQSTRADFGDDWGDFRKKAFAAGIYLTSNLKDQDIRDMTPELQEAFPERFPEGQTDPRLLLEAAVDAAEKGAPQIVPLDEYQRWQEGQTGQSTDAQDDELWDKMRRAVEAFSDAANVERTLRGRKNIKDAEKTEPHRFDLQRDVYRMSGREMDAAIDLLAEPGATRRPAQTTEARQRTQERLTEEMLNSVIEPRSDSQQAARGAIMAAADSFLDGFSESMGNAETYIPGIEKVSTGPKAAMKTPAKVGMRDSANFLYRKIFDSGEAVTRLGKYTNNPHLYHYFNMARASSNAAVSMIQNAQTDAMGRKVGDGLNSIFEEIRKKGDQYYRYLQAYMFHVHNIDRMSRENPGAVASAQEELEQFRRENPEFNGMADFQIERLANDPISMYHEQAKLYMEILNRLRKANLTHNKPVFDVNIDAEISRAAAAELREILEKTEGFEEDVEKIYKYIDNLMQYRIDSGLITEQDYQQLKQIYPHYVPTNREMVQLAEELAQEGRAREKNRREIGKTIKRAEGGNQRIQALHKSLAQQTFSVVREGSKNRFGQMLLDGNTQRQSRGMIRDVKQSEEGFHEDTFDMEEDPTPKKTNTFTVRQDGKRWDLMLDKAMFEAVEALSPDPAETNIAAKIARGSNDLFKALCTGYNPTFLVRNFMRDLQDAGLYSKDLSEFAKQYPKAAKEIATNGKYWQMYQALGGLYSSIFDYQTGELKKSGKLKKNTIDRLEWINMAVEQAPRLAEFMATVKKAERAGGATMDNLMEAMYNAADVTVNFGRSGKWGRAANRYVIPFLNPGLQGFDKMVRTVTETQGFKGWTRLAAKSALLGIAPAVISRLLFGKRKDWDEIKQRDKDIYYLFPLNDEGLWLKLPKGRVLSIFGMAADRAMQMKEGKDVDWGGFISTALQQTAPANPIQNSILQPLVGTKLFNPSNPGETWYGTDIESQRLRNLAPGQRYDATTDAVSKWLGKTFNLSPKKINYLLDQYSGVVGDVLLPITSQRAEKDLFSAAFTLDSVMSNQLSEDFYDIKDRLTWMKNDPDSTGEDEALYKYWNEQTSAIGDINKAIRTIEEDKDLSEKEKRELTRVQYALRNGIMRNALDTMEDYKAGGTDNDISARVEEARAQEARESATYTFKGEKMAWDDLSGKQKKLVMAQETIDKDKNADLTEIFAKNNATTEAARYTAARDAGISNQTYLNALKAIDNADNGNGTYNQAEVQAGLDQMVADRNISQKDAATVWQIITNGKNNPYSSGKLELPSVSETANPYEGKTYTFKGEKKPYSELTSRQQKIVRAQDTIKGNPDADLSDILIGEDKKATKLVSGYQTAREAGISNETYLTALTAIDDADNGDGNYTQKNEVNPALQELVDEGKISSKDASTIWKIITGGADKNNPFPVGAITMGLRLPKIG